MGKRSLWVAVLREALLLLGRGVRQEWAGIVRPRQGENVTGLPGAPFPVLGACWKRPVQAGEAIHNAVGTTAAPPTPTERPGRRASPASAKETSPPAVRRGRGGDPSPRSFESKGPPTLKEGPSLPRLDSKTTGLRLCLPGLAISCLHSWAPDRTRGRGDAAGLQCPGGGGSCPP